MITILLLDFFGVIGLGIFGSRYAIAKEIIEYDGTGNETSYTSIKTNENGLPKKVTIENKNGNYILEIEYDKKGAMTTHGTYDFTLSKWSFTIKYDQYGNIVRNTLEFPDGDKDVTEYDYTYDKKGNMLKKVTTVDDKETEKYTWEYDKEDNITFASYEDLSDETNNYTYYHDNTYKGGKMIKCATYNEDDQLLYVANYEYKKDKLVYLEIEDAEGALYSYTKYRYDDEGNLTKQTTYNEADIEITRYEYDYDKNGNCVYKEFYQMNRLITATEYNFYNKKVKLSDAQVNIFSTLKLVPSPDQIVFMPSYQS